MHAHTRWLAFLAGTAALIVTSSLLCTSVASAAEPGVVAVWALAGGNTPLADAQVRIVEDHRVLRESNGRPGERTSRGGVSLLAFGRLPHRFTVAVIPRRRLGGSFRAVVRG